MAPTRRALLGGAAALPAPAPAPAPLSHTIAAQGGRQTVDGPDAALLRLCGEAQRLEAAYAGPDQHAFDAALHAIAGHSATTLVGLQAKARLLLLLSPALDADEPGDAGRLGSIASSTALAPDERLLISLLRDILALTTP